MHDNVCTRLGMLVLKLFWYFVTYTFWPGRVHSTYPGHAFMSARAQRLRTSLPACSSWVTCPKGIGDRRKAAEGSLDPTGRIIKTTDAHACMQNLHMINGTWPERTTPHSSHARVHQAQAKASCVRACRSFDDSVGWRSYRLHRSQQHC
jgi:hypothetical protein